MSAMNTEQLIPILSPGRHRTPRTGACFMEFASYLAGSRWSDHPACTHPSLAALARLVNDTTSDAARGRMTVLVPSVVGLTGDDPRVPLHVAVLAAASALPIANMSRQRALAAGLLRCESLLGDDPYSRAQRARIRAALDSAPGAERWAVHFQNESAMPPPRPIAANDESMLRVAVFGIAEACVPDADARLELLLETAIAECRDLLRPSETAAPSMRHLVTA